MYETLLSEAEKAGVDTYEKSLPSRIKGLYSNKVIWINKKIVSNSEKTCILAEELGHHFTTVGDILDQSKISNRKQELIARRWAYSRLIPLSKIVQAQKLGIRNSFELAEYLGVTEEFLESALNRFKEKYGLYASFEGYTIVFEPLGVLERIE